MIEVVSHLSYKLYIYTFTYQSLSLCSYTARLAIPHDVIL